MKKCAHNLNMCAFFFVYNVAIIRLRKIHQSIATGFDKFNEKEVVLNFQVIEEGK